jgi:hypothetical protein
VSFLVFTSLKFPELISEGDVYTVSTNNCAFILSVPDAEPVKGILNDAPRVGSLLGVGVGVGELVTVGVGVPVGVPVGVGVGEASGVGVGDGVIEIEGVAVGVLVGVEVGVPVGVGVVEVEIEGVGDGVFDTVGVGDGVGDGEGTVPFDSLFDPVPISRLGLGSGRLLDFNLGITLSTGR